MTRPLHILIIDDDPDDADFLMQAFSGHLPDTRFTTVRNGQEGLDLLFHLDQKDFPDVVFLDLHMPGKTGYQVLGELKSAEQCRDLPVMVISTSLLPSEAERCRQAGCADYFIKPSSMDDYDAIVKATSDFFEQKEAMK